MNARKLEAYAQSLEQKADEQEAREAEWRDKSFHRPAPEKP
jgi:hypothetical protein